MAERIRLTYDTPVRRGQVTTQVSESGVIVTMGPPSARELWGALEPTLTTFIPLTISVCWLAATILWHFATLRYRVEVVVGLGLLTWWWVNCGRSLLTVYYQRRGSINFVITEESIVLPWSARNPFITVRRDEITDISVGIRRKRFLGYNCSLRIDRRVGPSLWLLSGMTPASILDIVIALRESLGLKRN